MHRPVALVLAGLSLVATGCTGSSAAPAAEQHAQSVTSAPR